MSAETHIVLLSSPNTCYLYKFYYMLENILEISMLFLALQCFAALMLAEKSSLFLANIFSCRPISSYLFFKSRLKYSFFFFTLFFYFFLLLLPLLLVSFWPPPLKVKEVMFSPLSVCLSVLCWFVCLFVFKITQKVVDGLGWNLVDRLGVWHGRNDSILVKLWIWIWIQELFNF